MRRQGVSRYLSTLSLSGFNANTGQRLKEFFCIKRGVAAVKI